MWEYLSVLLSDYFAVKTVESRLLAGIWLLVNTLLLFLYSGQLYDFIIRGQIVDSIERKTDIVSKRNWAHSNIYIIDDAISDYIIFNALTLNDPVAKQIVERCVIADIFGIYFSPKVRRDFFEKVFKENAIISANKLNANLLVRRVQMESPIIKNNYIEELDFRISQPDTPSKNYYLFWNRDNFKQNNLEQFNDVYGINYHIANN